MKATRRQQPYRSTLPRAPGAALTAMTKGRSMSGWNPADVKRAAMLTRPKRRQRPPRPQRPPR